MVNIEGRSPEVNDNSNRVSEVLNEAFTPLMQTFRDKIKTVGWLNKDTTRWGKPHDIEIWVDKLNFYKHNFEFDPDLYTHCPRWYVGKNSDISTSVPIIFQAPCGEYGDSWSKKLVSSAIKLAEGAFSPQSEINVIDKANEINENYAPILEDYTYRGKNHPNTPYKGPIVTHCEGFHSILLTAGYFTMNRVPGYESDPERLLKDLTYQGIFSQFSLLVPPQRTAELALESYVLTNPISVDENGKLQLSRHIIYRFKDQRDDILTKKSAGAKPLNKPGCPLGRVISGNDENGVDIGAELFFESVIAQKARF